MEEKRLCDTVAVSTFALNTPVANFKSLRRRTIEQAKPLLSRVLWILLHPQALAPMSSRNAEESGREISGENPDRFIKMFPSLPKGDNLKITLFSNFVQGP